MKIAHVAVYTPELECLRDFYTLYFGGTAGKPYHNAARGFRSCFIRFESGATLEIMTLEAGLAPAREGSPAIGYAHLAFTAGSRSAVDGLTDRLERDGYPVASRPRVTGDGFYESCVLDPDGNQVEIVAGE